MSKSETELRHHLAAAMKPCWLLTWHEDREINPGVPDLSFVLYGGLYETGWIELKAADKDLSEVKLERSQHAWFNLHATRIPCFILVMFKERLWLVDAVDHGHFQTTMTVDRLNAIAIGATCSLNDTKTILQPILAFRTHRGR